MNDLREKPTPRDDVPGGCKVVRVGIGVWRMGRLIENDLLACARAAARQGRLASCARAQPVGNERTWISGIGDPASPDGEYFRALQHDWHGREFQRRDCAVCW